MADNQAGEPSGVATATAHANAAPAVAPAAAPAAPAQPSAAHQSGAPYAQYPNAYGQTYQPYQQYGYSQHAGAYGPAQQVYPQAAPAPEVAETRVWMFSKSVLHALAIVFSICTLGMGLSFTTTDQPYLAAIACPVPVMSLIWSGAELIVRAVRKFKSGIHPGGQVAGSLIVWLAAAIVGPLESVFSLVNDSYCDYDYDNLYYSEPDVECTDAWAGKYGVWIAISAFTCLLWLIYFTLFIFACIDTSRRNAARKFVYMVQPSNWPHAAQGWYPMPQQQAGAPAQQQPQQGQYMTAPQPARTRESTAVPGHVPVQQAQTPSPITPYATPGEGAGEKSTGLDDAGPSQPQGGHGVREFYTPGGAN